MWNLLDETSARRGQRYVTVLVDEDTRQLLFITEGPKAEPIQEFVQALEFHGGEADKAFDHFLIAALARKAQDEV
jgi:hypothetical protein